MTAMTSHLPRPTIRFRLTLLYGGLFLLAIAVLLGITYIAFATTNLTVNVGSDGQVRVTLVDPSPAETRTRWRLRSVALPQTCRS